MRRMHTTRNEAWDGAAHRGVSGHPSNISERIYLTTSLPPAAICHHRVSGRARRLTSRTKLALTSSLRPINGARVAVGESLRALAREYGVSHECIRRISLAVAS